MKHHRLQNASTPRYVGVIQVSCHGLPLLPNRFTQRNLSCISKLMMNHQQKIGEATWTLPWFSYGHQKYTFLDSLTGFIGPLIMFIVECEVVNKFCRGRSNSFKHVTLWCFSFDPYLTTHQSNIGVRLRNVTKQNLQTFCVTFQDS